MNGIGKGVVSVAMSIALVAGLCPGLAYAGEATLAANVGLRALSDSADSAEAASSAEADPASSPAESYLIRYKTHVQTFGWQDWVQDGAMSGTEGQAKRLEGIDIELADSISGSVKYCTHVQTFGWQDWVQDGAMSGTEGQAKRLEAIQIKLDGDAAEQYDVWYRVHCQKIGWMGWAKNGAMAGTAGFSYRLEGIEVKLLPKGSDAPGATSGAYRDARGDLSGVPDSESLILYRTHVQTYGWQNIMRDGELAGTEGQAKRLEALNVKLGGAAGEGGVEYCTHVQRVGWQDPVKDGKMSGTKGESLRLEAVKIWLTGEAEKAYDIYYRVHCQKIGWMGWAKNGEPAGTEGYAYRLEGIQIVLVDKEGGKAPESTGATTDAFRKNG